MSAESNQQTIDSVLKIPEREVWIITAAAGEDRGGLLATWVHRASIDPARPVLMTGIAPNHFTAELIDRSGAFAAHLLLPGQLEVAWNFALDSGRQRDKLGNLATERGSQGSPLLADCLARLECRVYSRLETGDRTYYWADVNSAAQLKTGTPLTDRQLIDQATPEQKARMLSGLREDVDALAPQQAKWRDGLPEWLRP